VNDCCQDTENRGPVERVSEDLSFTRCLVCEAKHFELELDPDEIVGEVNGL